MSARWRAPRAAPSRMPRARLATDSSRRWRPTVRSSPPPTPPTTRPRRCCSTSCAAAAWRGRAGCRRGVAASCGRLLNERRDALRQLLDEAGIAYRLDPSNADPAHLRNRVRAELLPLLEDLRPGAVERLGPIRAARLRRRRAAGRDRRGRAGAAHRTRRDRLARPTLAGARAPRPAARDRGSGAARRADRGAPRGRERRSRRRHDRAGSGTAVASVLKRKITIDASHRDLWMGFSVPDGTFVRVAGRTYTGRAVGRRTPATHALTLRTDPT